MTIPVVTFTNERTGVSASLAADDLPNTPIKWASQLRKEVTQYNGTNRVTVQVFGVVFEPITLEGVLDDTYGKNTRGHAQQQRALLESLVNSGDILRLSYNRDERWGFLRCDFDEETDDRIKYILTFEVLYNTPPQPVSLALLSAPIDTITEIGDLFDALDAEVRAKPSSVADILAGRVFLALATAQNRYAEAVRVLSSTLYYADMTAEEAGRVARALAGVMLNFGDMQAALSGASGDALSVALGGGELLAASWRDGVLASTRATASACFAFYMQLRSIAQPFARRTHLVVDGETLETLALKYYGDFTLWTHIADANNIETDVVEVGAIILIPNKPRV